MSALIVAMVKTKTLQPKKRTRKSKGLGSVGPVESPPFPTQFCVIRGDERDPEPDARQDVMPLEMEKAAWEYLMWTLDGRKNTPPLFSQTVDNLCKLRVCISMGFGSCIYFESRVDALAMIEFYQ